MKPSFATITLLFFLFAFSIKSSLVRAATPEPVLDTSGEKLKAGESYYIVLPGIVATGLSFNTFGNNTCPHVVVQENFSRGKPVKFLPLNPKNHVIYTSRNLNIEFSDMITTCIESGVWKITKFISEALNVATNGAAGSDKDKLNWFMIEKAESDGAYKLRFCPDPKVYVCQDLGIFSYEGKSYVGLANPGKSGPFTVRFDKVDVKNAINDDVDVISSS